MKYAEAAELADSGRPIIVSYSGGRSRYMRFVRDGDAIAGCLFGHPIAVFTPDHVRLDTCGYDTATTTEAMDALVGGVYHDKFVLYHKGRAFEDGRRITISYDDVASLPFDLS